MDRPLSADRFSSGPGDSGGYHGNHSDGRGGGGGGGRRYGGRGRGGYRGGRGYRGGGRDRGRRHEPYGRGRGGGGGSRYGRGGGGGGNEPRGNRFYAEPQLHDHRSMLLKQLNELLHQVGQLPQENSDNNNGAQAPTEEQQEQPQQRWVVRTMAQNVTSLSKVLCAKADLFLQAQPSSLDASVVAGPLASGLVQAAAVGPLQTPCYAALALAVQQQDSLSNSALVDGGGRSTSEFAQRTVQYAVRLLARDMDTLLLVEPPPQQAPSDFSSARGNAPSASAVPEPVVRIAQRVRLVLRYLGLLSQVGIVQSASSNGGEDSMGFDPVVASTNHQAVTFHGLLQSIVQAASLLQRGGSGGGGSDEPPRPDLAILLAYIVYSTLPYLVQQSSANGELDPFWQEQIVQPLQAILETYQSDFELGVGSKAILLKYEQMDEKVGKDDEEEEEEDEDDDDEGAPNPVCDNLQDLHRCIQSLLSSLADQNLQQPQYRFALFTDAPWKSLFKPKEDVAIDGMDVKVEGEGEEAVPPPEPDEPLVYTGEPLSLSLFPECLSLTFILGGPVAVKDDTESTVLASRIDLDCIVIGRLPIFGSPRDPDDEEEDDDDEMDEGPKNERLETFSKTFGLVDRYFLGEAVRDCLISHEPKVTDTGVERGNVKAATEQVWSIRQLLLSETKTASAGDASGENPAETADSTVGFEFVVVEAILSLIVQSSSNHDVLGLSYLSRVLLELVKLEPGPMAAATVHAVATLCEDYMPSLVPSARRNLSQWFAFHLIHSNYQWPTDYWNHWDPFVQKGWKNSRGGFVKDSLSIMMENVSDPMALLSQIPTSLGEALVPEEGPSVPPQVDTLIQDLSRRIHDMNEDPSLILAYLGSDELQESLTIDLQAETNEQHRTLWRTKAVARALLMPMFLDNKIFRTTFLTRMEERRNESGNDTMEEDPVGDSSDALAQIVTCIPQYRSLVEGAISKDIEGESSPEIPFFGEGVLLDQIAELADYSQSIFSFVLNLFAEEKLITPMGILRWFLGGNNDSSFRSDVAALRWSEHCANVIKVSLKDLFTVVTDYGHMILDDNEDSKTTKTRNVRNAETFLEFASPLMKFLVGRVHSLLLASGADADTKKMTPQDIVVMEGCKQLVRFTKEAYFSSLKHACVSSTQGFYAEILEIHKGSSLAGQSLASLCSTSDTNPTKLLFQTLERS